ncbi:MAG: hypothetical protein IPP00_02400 [Actinomycetales bacterium]|uniref:Uncharacterized protein n=1 Tax=Candidatus Phosphoribacter hodrii TaxID=2953743 RepID=A0A9D7XTJ7_9MICO|nr:hypothetical protein [Candidatus Phosphoribacter hodrii]
MPLGELTQVSGFDDSDLKDAFAQGRIGLQGTLDDTKTSGVVTFPDGTTMPVALVGAHTAYTGLAVPQGRPCASNERCAGLVVTGATLGTTTLLTNRGQATVPAWRFSVAGLTQPIVRVAIDPASMATPPAPSFDSRPTNLGVEVAQLIGVSGNEIRYQLWIGACETEPRPLVHEEADIIVLGGVVTPPPPNSLHLEPRLGQRLGHHGDACRRPTDRRRHHRPGRDPQVPRRLSGGIVPACAP